MIRPLVDRFELFLNEPIRFGARILLAFMVLPLVLSFAQPLWRITLHAPQYPSGLHMDIYAYKLDGGHDGHDIEEINELNHYIGMHRIDRSAFQDLDWLPFAIGLLAFLALRTAVIGNVRTLIDLVSDADARKRFAAAGLQRAREFDWAKTARVTLEALAKA